MNLSVHSSFFLLLVIIIFPLILLHKSVEANEYEECRRTYQCGNVTVSYPFYGHGRPAYCGHPDFEFNCNDGDEGIPEMPEITVTTSTEKYYLLRMDPTSPTISIARQDIWSNGYCPDNWYNITLKSSLFKYTDTPENVTFYYECPINPLNSAMLLSCSNSSPVYFLTPSNFNLRNDLLIICNKSLIVPVSQSQYDLIRDVPSLITALRNGVELNWIADNGPCRDCRGIGGECGSDNTGGFACYCPDEVHLPRCHTNAMRSRLFKKKLKTAPIVIASAVVGSAMIAVALLYFTRTKASQKLNILTKEERRDCQDVEAMLRCYGEHAPKRYNYGEIKKMTSCFKEKLGEGGYGGVYKGNLQNGSLVAVKLLKNPNCKGTDFINEVASISGTNHVNIVTLLGYCFQGRKRALVYDFLPNGSLDKYIYCGQNQNPLAWETLLQIAIGIGRGLEYLHQGCRTCILHFDIKPHNILLDAKFCPKISDFGLAMPFLQTKSLMTMSGTRGTPGYIAPEVLCRGFGGASHKSDVYSYGMLVLDLVGCRKNNVAGSAKTSSELYFPHYIYNQFELNEDHELQGISNDGEKLLQRKLVIAGLWCIQTNPSSRPSISRAVEMLEGDLESLQIPPIPSLFSPPRSYQHNSSTNSMTC